LGHPTALLDANVLHPMVLCDLFIRLARRGLYRALWSREILEEVVRSIARRRPDLSVDVLRRRTDAMERAIQDATVAGYESLLPGLQELGDDARVAAAAVAGHADVIVTSNIKDFPAVVLDRHGISVQSPDDFLVDIWWLDPTPSSQARSGLGRVRRGPGIVRRRRDRTRDRGWTAH
jgi:hypothetical protein